MSVLLVLGLLIGLAAVPVLIDRKLLLANDQALLRDLAQFGSLQFVTRGGEPSAVGQRGGALIEVSLPRDSSLVLIEAEIASELSVAPALGQIERHLLGDEIFDEKLVVLGEGKLALLARMDVASRQRLLLARERYQVRCVKGRWKLRCRAELGEMLACLEEAVALARWGRPQEGDLTARLLERASSDPMASIRAEALKLAIPRVPPDDPRLAELGDDVDPVVAFHAAAARGLPGSAQILRLLAHEDPLVSETAALALVERPEWRSQPWLEEKLALLCTIRPTERLIGALGEVGSARSVPMLRGMVGRLGLGAQASAARRAIEQIQGRLSERRGALALVAEGGQVSLATAPGQVSVVDPEESAGESE